MHSDTNAPAGANSANTRNSSPLASQAYDRLKSSILNNDIETGRFYLERELEGLLGFSRTPIKEALVRLENEGLILVQPRHGIRVQPLSADDMAEIYQIITCLECEAVSTLANRGLCDQDIARLEDTGLRMAEALERDALEDWARADEDFHRLLLELCGNSRLKQTVLNFWDQAHRARYFTLHMREKPTLSTNDHKAVIEAIKKGDVVAAVERHRQHRLQGGEALVGIIRQFYMGSL